MLQNNTIRPPFLQQGDTVFFVSPAGKITPEEVLPTASLFESWGLKVILSSSSFSSHYRFAGSDAERIIAMQYALDNEQASAILCNRGGYGSLRILEQLDFSKFKKHPKWLIGFSDITVFHSYCNRHLNCETLHAPMPVNLSQNSTPKETLENFRKALFGEELVYRIKNTHSQNIPGEAKAPLIGGNLATLCNLIGTGYGYDMEGKILFIEDIGEPIHKIDQFLWALKYSGKLASLKGLIVGSFTDIDTTPEFGKSIEELIIEIAAPHGYPIAFDFPVGHCPHNYPLFVGREVVLKVTRERSYLCQ